MKEIDTKGLRYERGISDVEFCYVHISAPLQRDTGFKVGQTVYVRLIQKTIIATTYKPCSNHLKRQVCEPIFTEGVEVPGVLTLPKHYLNALGVTEGHEYLNIFIKDCETLYIQAIPPKCAICGTRHNLGKVTDDIYICRNDYEAIMDADVRIFTTTDKDKQEEEEE